MFISIDRLTLIDRRTLSCTFSFLAHQRTAPRFLHLFHIVPFILPYLPPLPHYLLPYLYGLVVGSMSAYPFVVTMLPSAPSRSSDVRRRLKGRAEVVRFLPVSLGLILNQEFGKLFKKKIFCRVLILVQYS